MRRKFVVLVVEDHTGMRKIVKTALQQLGIKVVVEAANGIEALAILQERNAYRTSVPASPELAPIDFIVCDWAMPRMDGLKLLEAVKANSLYSQLPFIMLTAENESSQIASAVTLGVTDYIIKPFTSGILEAKLRGILDSLA